VIFSFLIFQTLPQPTFWVGLILMAAATWFLVTDTISIQHTHLHKHTKMGVRSVGDDLVPEMVEYTHSHFHAHQKENEEDHDHSHPSDAGANTGEP